MSLLFADIRQAVTLLTVLPFPGSSDSGPAAKRTAAFFPVVGLLIGAFTVLFLAGVNSLEFVLGDDGLFERLAPLVAPVVLIGWAAVTRMLHWDGLADVGDAWWGGHTVERRLEIMRDSRVGAFGVTTLVLIAIVQTVALATILQHASLVGWAVLAAPVLGRMSATFAAWLGKPARLEGLGVSIMRRPDPLGVVVASIAVVVGLSPLVLLLGVHGWIIAGTGVLVSPVVPHLVSMRFGGVTGDVMGASVILTETIFLFVAAVVGVI